MQHIVSTLVYCTLLKPHLLLLLRHAGPCACSASIKFLSEHCESVCRTAFDIAFTFEERVMEQLVDGKHRCKASMHCLPWYAEPFAAMRLRLTKTRSKVSQIAAAQCVATADMTRRSQGTMRALLVVNMVRQVERMPRSVMFVMSCCITQYNCPQLVQLASMAMLG